MKRNVFAHFKWDKAGVSSVAIVVCIGDGGPAM